MKKKKNPDTYEILGQLDEATGDWILPIPADLLKHLGWEEGDEVHWSMTKDGKWMLSRKTS